MAQREFDTNQAQAPQLAAELIRKHYISDKVAFQCARYLLHYRETHGEDPSADQMEKMVEISKQLETKGYNPLMIVIREKRISFLIKSVNSFSVMAPLMMLLGIWTSLKSR